jgi:hypothetical protein
MTIRRTDPATRNIVEVWKARTRRGKSGGTGLVRKDAGLW